LTVPLGSPRELVEWKRGGDRENVGVDDFYHQFLSCFHLADHLWIREVGCDAGIGETPSLRDAVGRALIDPQLDAGPQIQPDGKEELQPGSTVAFRVR
jgi:hypothetical protein